ncbi:MAG: neuromedin U [Gammaproteobacteria bacterium]
MKSLITVMFFAVFSFSSIAQADEKAQQLMKEAAEKMNEASSKTGQGKEQEVDDLVFEAVKKAQEARQRIEAQGVDIDNSNRYVGYGNYDGPDKKNVDQAANLREKTQNPVSSLISVPLESNFNFDVGPEGNTQYVLNVKPVIPQKVNDDWNWIHRGIQPIIVQDNLTDSPTGDLETDSSIFGLGDLTYQGFLTPGKPSKVIWGVGGVLTVPWGDDGLSTEKWQTGPAFVALTKVNRWVFGSVISQQWDFAGRGSADDVSLAVWQYFINYNLEKGWFLLSTPTMSANWEAEKTGDRLTIPVGGGLGRLFKIGGKPFRASVQAFGYPASPDNVDTDWTLQAEFRLLFPR